MELIGKKPKILLVCDVKGWAWWLKSQYLKKYLSDEFDIDIKLKEYELKDGTHDLYFTYGFKHGKKMEFTEIPKQKRICGVTAHRNKNNVQPTLERVGWVHANSMLLLNELKVWGFKNPFYLPNGVDDELFRPRPKIVTERTGFVAGHVGKMSQRKGQAKIINPAIERAGCQSLLHTRGNKAKIPHNEMSKVYNKMDVFLVASTEDGTPNPALEALACGVPVISNRMGNMPELIVDGYNGFLVDMTIPAYVKKINYLKKHPKILEEMKKNARESIQNGWLWKHQAENYRNMFRKILKRVYGYEKT